MTDYDGSRLPVDGGSRFIIDGDDIPFGAYQAIYHKLTKKTEKLSHFYNDAYEIEFSDLQSQHSKIEQALKQYSISGKKIAK